jgi:hypothetical protein
MKLLICASLAVLLGTAAAQAEPRACRVFPLERNQRRRVPSLLIRPCAKLSIAKTKLHKMNLAAPDSKSRSLMA